MSRQLWGWIGAVVAGAALMAPAASAHAAPSGPDSPAIGSSNAPGDQSSATPRGYKLTITRAGNNVPGLWINKADMNRCHPKPSNKSGVCPDRIAVMKNNDKVYAHCQVAGEPVYNNATWIFALHGEKTGYMAGHYILEQDVLKKVKACSF